MGACWLVKRRSVRSPTESYGRACFRLGRLFFPVFWWGTGFERGEQPLRDFRDVLDRRVEGRLVRLGRLAEAGYLPHILQRSGAYLILRCRRVEVEKRLDVPTHRTRPPYQ